MMLLGQFGLLSAFVFSGYACCALLLGRRSGHAAVVRSGTWAAAAGAVGLSVTIGVLAWALAVKDFRFDYVGQYSSRLLPWNYSLSALWVGQAGSLLLWAWILAALALVFRWNARRADRALADTAGGLLWGYVWFLCALMLFAADPMRASLASGGDGAGLSPLLQHPAMLIHPPVVFLGYAAWSVPFALAMGAIFTGRLDTVWIRLARPWALLAWSVLGAGVLLGADWAYEELGWGGYWSWDPVENGSLLPWLTGTALIHALMVWRLRGGMKKTALALAVATFALCNFATFLTRSGVFSSLHAFSQSPIGWMFLGLLLLLILLGAGGIYHRRAQLKADHRLSSLWSREALVMLSTGLLLALTVAVLAGTLMLPLSTYLFGSTATVGPEFYNRLLAPVGLSLLGATALAPLLRWGGAPPTSSRPGLVTSVAAGALAMAVALAEGVRQPQLLAVLFLAAVATVALVAAVIRDVRRREPDRCWRALPRVLWRQRRAYLGYAVHLGFMGLAIGIAGSALGTHRHEVTLYPGEQTEWAGRSIRYRRFVQDAQPDKLIAAVELEISEPGRASYLLTPARHLHLLQNQWTTEVAIHADWRSDFYAVLHYGQDQVVSLSFVENPLMRWIWFGGGVSLCAALTSLVISPRRRRAGTFAAPAEYLPAPQTPLRQAA